MSALACVLRDKTEAALVCGDLLVKRKEMVQAWANFNLSESI
jgi:hypothetical protein